MSDWLMDKKWLAPMDRGELIGQEDSDWLTRIPESILSELGDVGHIWKSRSEFGNYNLPRNFQRVENIIILLFWIMRFRHKNESYFI